jgi:phospholipid/cholesterol/gamma-HCH transport system permease protein
VGDRPVDWHGFTATQRALLDRVGQRGDADAARAAAVAAARPEGALARLGRGTVALGSESLGILAFLGEATVVLGGEILHPSRLRWRAVLHHVGVTGVAALPIVGLLGILMGIVVAYQGAGQLARYGANIFVVDLVGLSMLREFAPLVTAIIVAGRSGSAFAAQLGTMAVTEEIDALRALGLSPTSVLVLPRLLALVIALPLLTLFADALGIAGGMVMGALRLHVTFTAFLERLPHAVSATTLMLGIGKAPIFAGIVAVVGCYQGLRTSGGADSVGRQTTRSVVQSIFLVIVADAVFSVAFSMLDL